MKSFQPVSVKREQHDQPVGKALKILTGEIDFYSTTLNKCVLRVIANIARQK
jgi:hypothetical protein